MVRHISEDHSLTQAWSASGNYTLDLSGKPYTITRMDVTIAPTITTAATTLLGDPWDRIVSTLNLTGKDGTYLGFQDAISLYHWTRLSKGVESYGATSRRQTIITTQTTGAQRPFVYRIHFGRRPKDFAGMDDPYDLTAGIPPMDKGNLNLSGQWGAAAAMGTAGVLSTSTLMRVHLYGVQPEAGDSDADYLPQAMPNFQTLSSTSGVLANASLFSLIDNVPSGDILAALVGIVQSGATKVRDSSILGSSNFYNQYGSRAVESYQVYSDLETASQGPLMGLPPSDSGNDSSAFAGSSGATAGTIAPVGGYIADPGLFIYRLWRLNSLGGLYGVNLQGAATGDLQHRFGVAAGASTATLEYVYEKYRLNTAHPMAPAQAAAHPALKQVTAGG